MNILLTHGSSDSGHQQAATALAEKVAMLLGDAVSVAHLGERLPQGARVMPLLLSEGHHLSEDVPAMVEDCHGHIVAGPYAYPDAVAAMLGDAADALRGRCRAVLLALYRILGSHALVSALYRQSKRFPLPAVAGLHGSCTAGSVLKLWQQEGIEQASVQPVLLFPGRSLQELARVGDGVEMALRIGAPLAEHADFPAWVAGRFREVT